MQRKGKIKFVNTDKSLFYETVKERIENYFIENNLSKHANTAMIVKSIILLAGYIVPFFIILIIHPSVFVCMLLWFFMGLNLAGIGMSVMHDANHGAYSANKNVNTWMGYTLNLLGGTVFNWKLQHNILHHTYTNIVDMDDDIDDKAVMRFSPHKKLKVFHRLQFVYAFFFYGLLTLYWTLGKDFVQYAKYTANGVNANSKKENRIILAKITLIKIIYFFIFLIVPVLFFQIPFWQVITGFLIMHFIGGVILTVVFQLAHTVEGTTHPLPTEYGTIENCWAIHQMNTTVNFSTDNKWISWYVGGLNFQVEHHLFPKICHVHYPRIAHIVKNTATDFNIAYMENKTFMQALHSHVITLHRFGKLPDINEAIG
ncbi:MAG: acyl-CoA desaturase [Fimbriimonadaceae bacterium]|nr:acyl-CoA desaturase [Chitinophagales bacterium]